MEHEGTGADDVRELMAEWRAVDSGDKDVIHGFKRKRVLEAARRARRVASTYGIDPMTLYSVLKPHVALLVATWPNSDEDGGYKRLVDDMVDVLEGRAA